MSTNLSESESGSGAEVPPTFNFSRVFLKGRRPKVTLLMGDERAWAQVLMLIRQGVFDHIAAKALGISASTWYRWMAKGEQDEAEGNHTHVRDFWEQVSAAKAQARVTKELQVGQMDPRFWLRNGPGKTKRNDPGWTDNIAVVGDGEADPLRVEGEFVAAVGFEDPEPTDLAATLQALAQLGFLEGQSANAALKAGGRIVDVNLPTPDEEYEDNDEDIGAKGYNPQRGKQPQDVDRVGPESILPSDMPDIYR
jgi:hypothetical protein